MAERKGFADIHLKINYINILAVNGNQNWGPPWGLLWGGSIFLNSHGGGESEIQPDGCFPGASFLAQYGDFYHDCFLSC